VVTRRQRQQRASARNRDLTLQALQLRASGATYRQIGEVLGIDKMTAWRLVQEESAKEIQESAREVLQLELQRLDRLLMAVWPDAINGDVQAINGALKIEDMRCRLLGLYDRAGEQQQQGDVQQGVIIIRGETQEEYIAGLRAMRGIGELPMPLPPSNGHKTTQENG
jgi:Homeodomain-like domain